jgi:hypothetical protein
MELTTNLTLLESYALEARAPVKRQKSYAAKEKEVMIHPNRRIE